MSSETSVLVTPTNASAVSERTVVAEIAVSSLAAQESSVEGQESQLESAKKSAAEDLKVVQSDVNGEQVQSAAEDPTDPHDESQSDGNAERALQSAGEDLGISSELPKRSSHWSWSRAEAVDNNNDPQNSENNDPNKSSRKLGHQERKDFGGADVPNRR